jgi:hypothetical protein
VCFRGVNAKAVSRASGMHCLFVDLKDSKACAVKVFFFVGMLLLWFCRTVQCHSWWKYVNCFKMIWIEIWSWNPFRQPQSEIAERSRFVPRAFLN